MRTTFLTIFAAAAMLSGGSFGYQAEAFTMTAPATLGAALPSLIQPVANICGSTGCVPVQTKKVQRFKNGSAVGQHI